LYTAVLAPRGGGRHHGAVDAVKNRGEAGDFARGHGFDARSRTSA
jgi:hypothetical protein